MYFWVFNFSFKVDSIWSMVLKSYYEMTNTNREKKKKKKERLLHNLYFLKKPDYEKGKKCN